MLDFKFLTNNSSELIFWKDRRGRQYDIKTLTTNHIHNIVRCLMGNGETYIPNPYEGRSSSEWFDIFYYELERRDNESV